MTVKSSKLASLVIACACCLLAAKPGLAQPPSPTAPTIDFYDPRCRVPELAPFKLQSNGVPYYATPSIWWYIVLNFNSVTQQSDGQRIGACLRVGNKDGETIAKSITCQTVGDVRVRRGVAAFNGGMVECDGINIGAAGAEIGIEVSGTIKTAPTFWMALKGSLSTQATGRAPLLRYTPVATTTYTSTVPTGTIALDLTPGGIPGFDASESPNVDLQGAGLAIVVQPDLPFTGLFETGPSRDGNGGIYTWSTFGSGRVDAVPVSSQFTQIGISDSTLTLGGLPSGERFYGTLDFVVLDPDGGGRGG